MNKKLPWPEIAVGLLVLLLGAGIFAWAHRDQGDLEESKLRGATIVAALQAYHAGAGRYPDSLQQLVPQHIDSVPAPLWGLQRWRYRRLLPQAATASAREYFQLSVAASSSGYPVLYYDVTTERWVLNN